MKTPRTSILLLSVFLLVIASACGLLQAPTPAVPDTGALYTQAAQTVIVQITRAAAAFTASPTVIPPTETSLPPTETPEPTVTPTETPTDTPTPIPPTDTPVPTNTPTRTPTPTPVPCLWAKLVEDVTVPRDTVFTPNSTFTKIWRVENIGTCAWNDEFDLVFADGDRMGPKVFDFPRDKVKPGESVDLSIELSAPDDEGRQRSYWMLRSDRNEIFGLGEDAEDPLVVEIKVVEATKNGYDFDLNYCSAHWRSNAGRLGCPGVKGDEDGFVMRVENPEIEINRLENEPALWTQPSDSRDGWIRGEYPEFDVESGQHFKAVVGCLNNARKCDVIFQLNYRVGDGDLQTLWEAQETYDDSLTKVDVDLSPLAGQKVKFILKVLVNRSPGDARAFWLAPRIVK